MLMERSTSDMEVLRRLQRNLTGSSGYARVTCILRLGEGNTSSFVEYCLGMDASMVYGYKSAHLHGGESGFLEDSAKGYWWLRDSSQLSTLCEELTKHVHTATKSAAKWIKSTFGIEYTVAGTVGLLSRVGFGIMYKIRDYYE